MLEKFIDNMNSTKGKRLNYMPVDHLYVYWPIDTIHGLVVCERTGTPLAAQICIIISVRPRMGKHNPLRIVEVPPRNEVSNGMRVIFSHLLV